MAFNSFDYAFFLGAAFLVFWRLNRLPRAGLVFLLVASYVFYFAWNGWLVLLILLSTGIDYACGHFIHRYRDRLGLKRTFLFVSLVANLALLCFFKYANFLIDNVNAASSLLGLEASLERLQILLPVGISFYTFQSLSYTIDVYQGEIEPARSPRDFFLFVAFFPQLIAGPIVRAKEFFPQLTRPLRLTDKDMGSALYLILRGLVKKMVLADFLARSMVDPVFGSVDLFSSAEVFLSLVAYHFQVYCDFSGYTDIALGSAKLFGFTLPENFDTPYRAHTPANFWRRWHMTLSRFVSDYVYVPLGGSRRGALLSYRNTFVTFALIGFWHGANWNFLLFGLYHAVGVVLTRALMAWQAARSGTSARAAEESLADRVPFVVLTNLFVVFSLPLFRSVDLAMARGVYARVFSLTGWSVGFSFLTLAVLAVAVVAHFVPRDIEQRLLRRFVRLPPVAQGVAASLVVLFAHRIAMLVQRGFVYFQF
jgi:alginate O-acetyltransferase complex protein AlgI